MAVEKMKTVGIVGRIADMDKICRAIVLNGSMHMLNALTEINSNYFKLSASEENLEAIEESAQLVPYTAGRDFAKDEEMIKSLYGIFDFKPVINASSIGIDHDYGKLLQEIEKEYHFIKELWDEVEAKRKLVEEKKSYMRNLNYMKDLNMDIGKLINLSYLRFRLLIVSRENYGRLKGNYENIASLILRLVTVDDNVIVASAAPKSFDEEIERLFISLNYQELKLPSGYSGTAQEIIEKIQSEIKAIFDEIKQLKASVQKRKGNIGTVIKNAYGAMELEKKVEKVKRESAIGKKLFFLFGYVPKSKVKGLQKELWDNFGSNIILVVDDAASHETAKAPPTKFKNNWLIRPFEALIRMYGLPSYDEVDPTAFFGLTYMLLFGAMFGDMGQGLIILLAGLYLRYKKRRVNLGGVLSRLGVSSIIFGALYGSVFGKEDLIPALLIRPMANINMILIWAIALGVVLMTVSFIYSFINNWKRHNLEEGLLGREGLVGFLFFWTLITAVANSQLGFVAVSLKIFIIIMAVLLLLNVFKQPIANMLKGSKKLYDESVVDYYTEAGFGVVETLLSFLSNTISFIRVGAFALNHAGLYLAFETMAEMVNSGIGGILILILGNAVIIGLEGLIVFIQGLRLEYYELFSRYYSGEGVEYAPIKLS
ncbi:V-type ATP synthase subunit I [Lutispora sp.]|uniref:V-type ATP synthase subunit I n=1 Tax=Lutispora sp. TaxID=2828727 RepID=UPI002B209968|nr:V-type ATPase 116kDa subunit family protein [Lutispora sp.]MEA4960884.1 V-type ATPase 116kDa subunit family protein [Lutispora sp.]